MSATTRRYSTYRALNGFRRQRVYDALRFPDARPVEECTEQISVERCQCIETKHGRPKAVRERALRCNRKDCPACYRAVKARNGNRVREKFDAAGLGIAYLVCTVPPELRGWYGDARPVRYTKAGEAVTAGTVRWAALRRSWWEIVRAFFGAEFCFEATHPRGDCPTCDKPECEGCGQKLVFHPHLNFLFALPAGARYKISREALEQLKVLWGEALGYKGEGLPVLHYQFAAPGTREYDRRTRGASNWCEYVPRPFPGWGWWVGHGRWYGNYPRKKWVEVTSFVNESGQREEKPERDKGYHLVMRVRPKGVRQLTHEPLGLPELCGDCQSRFWYRGTVSLDEYAEWDPLERARRGYGRVHRGVDPPWWKPGWRGFNSGGGGGLREPEE